MRPYPLSRLTLTKNEEKAQAKAARVIRKFKPKIQTNTEPDGVSSRDFCNPSSQLILWVAIDVANKQDKKKTSWLFSLTQKFREYLLCPVKEVLHSPSNL